MSLEEAVQLAKDFYGTKVPKTVTEYMKSYPEGLSRTTLKKSYGVSGAQFLTMLGSEYQAPLRAEDLIKSFCLDRGLRVLSNIHNVTTKSKVTYKCLTCDSIFTTTYDSLRNSKVGCSGCAGNKPLYLRPKFVQECATKVHSSVISIPSNNKGKVKLSCDTCHATYSITLSHLTNPSSKLEATCPNCRPTDKRVVYKGNTFDSSFELESYKLLEHLQPLTHVRYKDYFMTERQWSCDFVIGDYWVEVSNFKSDYKGYFKNIEAKRQVVESQGRKFFFLTSLDDVRGFIDMI